MDCSGGIFVKKGESEMPDASELLPELFRTNETSRADGICSVVSGESRLKSCQSGGRRRVAVEPL